jgi:hypothetical protein
MLRGECKATDPRYACLFALVEGDCEKKKKKEEEGGGEGGGRGEGEEGEETHSGFLVFPSIHL